MRLRRSQSKSESKPASDSHDDRADSPPPEYRSLGAQLSPRLDAELRAVCASIAHDYKPDPPPDVDRQDPIVQYAALSEAVRTEMENAATAAAETMTTARAGAGSVQKSYRPPRSRPLIPAVVNYGSDQYPQQQQDSSSRDVVYSYGQEPAETAYGYNPRHTSLAGPRVRQISAHKDSHSRSRSIPLPVAYPNGTHNGEHFEGSKPTSALAQSGDPIESTAYGEVSVDQDTGLSVPTPAAFSSSRNSKRDSSNNAQTMLTSNAPVLDSEWMRTELERHKKLQEARLQQEAHEQLVESFIGVSVSSQYGNSGRITRKPGSQSTSASKRTKEFYFDQCEPAPSTFTRSDSQRKFQQPIMNGERDALQGDLTQGASADLRIYFRPESIGSPNDAEEEPPPPVSRAESITRKVKDFIRTGSIRRASLDRRRRAQSIESMRSGVSSTSVETNASWWRSWKSRPAQSGETLESNGDEISFTGRGRAPTRDMFQQAPRKPVVDLNRQLPPLPSLDQWKDDADGFAETALPAVASKTNSSARKAENFAVNNVFSKKTSDLAEPSTSPLRRHQSNRQRSRSIHVEYPPEVAERIRTGDFNTSSAASGTLGLNIAHPPELSESTPAVLDSEKNPYRMRSSSALDTFFNASSRRSTDEPTRLRVRHHSYALSPSPSEGKMPTSATLPGPTFDPEDRSMVPRTTLATVDRQLRPQIQQPPQVQAQAQPKRKWWQSGRARKDSSGTWVERLKSGSKSGFQYPAATIPASSASIKSVEAGSISVPSCAVVPC